MVPCQHPTHPPRQGQNSQGNQRTPAGRGKVTGSKVTGKGQGKGVGQGHEGKVTREGQGHGEKVTWEGQGHGRGATSLGREKVMERQGHREIRSQGSKVMGEGKVTRATSQGRGKVPGPARSHREVSPRPVLPAALCPQASVLSPQQGADMVTGVTSYEANTPFPAPRSVGVVPPPPAPQPHLQHPLLVSPPPPPPPPASQAPGPAPSHQTKAPPSLLGSILSRCRCSPAGPGHQLRFLADSHAQAHPPTQACVASKRSPFLRLPLQAALRASVVSRVHSFPPTHLPTEARPDPPALAGLLCSYSSLSAPTGAGGSLP